MSTIELKKEIHTLIDGITDEAVLQRFFNLIKTGQGSLWSALSKENQEELLLSDEESNEPSNLLSHDEAKKRHSKWL